MAEDSKVESQSLVGQAARFRMPDIYESGIRGTELSPKQRAEKAQADAKAVKDKAAADKAKKLGKGKVAAAAEEADEEEDAAVKPAKANTKKGFVLVPRSWYTKAKTAMGGKK